MTRGPDPESTYREAAEIAGRRGTVKWFDRLDSAACTFAIFATGLVSLVKIRRIRRLHASPEEIFHEFAEAITRLKGAVLTRSVALELWLCSYHRTWRFFRIVEGGLREMDRHGEPLDGVSIMPSYGGP